MTTAEILARIEKNTRLIYEAATYTSVTQARLRSILADIDLMKDAELSECPNCDGGGLERPCPHVRQSAEGTAYCTLAESARTAALEEAAKLVEASRIGDIRGGLVSPSLVEDMVRQLVTAVADRIRALSVYPEAVLEKDRHF